MQLVEVVCICFPDIEARSSPMQHTLYHWILYIELTFCSLLLSDKK